MLTLKAPAKINWFLKVYGLQNDGYHKIECLTQTVSLYDILAFVPSKDLTLITDLQIPIEQNLVYKAAVLLKKECGISAGVEIRLNKNIPVAAGLGGGSSDAASTLLGLNEVWSLGLSGNDLCVFAEQLGADVTFFLHGPFSFVEGRGEKITACKAIKPINILLVKPPLTVSTRWVYGQLKNRIQNTEHRTQSTDNPPIPPLLKGGEGGFELTNRTDKVDNIKLFIHAVGKAELHRNSNIQNDLESVTIKSFPVIANIKDRLLREGAILSMMSGSGPTVFGVFGSAKEAENASKVFNDCWTAIVQTII